MDRAPDVGRTLPGELVFPGHGLWRSLVSALDWGSRGPGFKSRQPDHSSPGERPFLLRALAETLPPADGTHTDTEVQVRSNRPSLTWKACLGDRDRWSDSTRH